MAKLTEERCVACTPQSPLVTDGEIVELMLQLPDWSVVNDDVQKLERVFAFRTFAEALAFTNRVGAVAEEQDHHPELCTTWGRTTVRWWTHAIGGLHRNDFIMAAKTDELAES